MGYKINYLPQGDMIIYKRKRQRVGTKKVGYVGTILVIIAVLLAGIQKENVLRLIIPGDPEVTKAAFSEMTEELKRGESMQDALTAFCRSILLTIE